MAVTTYTLTGDLLTWDGEPYPLTGSFPVAAYLSASAQAYQDPGTATLLGPTIEVAIAADGSFTASNVPASSETGASYTLTVKYRPGGRGGLQYWTSPVFTCNASGRFDQMPFVDPTISDAQLLANATDAVVSGIVADENSLTNAALEAEIAEAIADATATFAPATGARPGNRIAVIGDSTVRGVYGNYDNEPGVNYGGTVATAFEAGDSWPTWAAALSGGRFHRAANLGVAGDTVALIDARITTDVIARTPKPTACIVYAGYNDAYANVTAAAFIATYRTAVARLIAAGIVPILATPLPTDNNATIAGLLVQYALHIRKFAHDAGHTLLDFQAWATNSATGAMIASIKGAGDGVHPSASGQKVLGGLVSTALSPLLPLTASVLMVGPLDTSNLAPNGLFAGTPSSGLAPSTFVYGSTPSGVTYSVVTDSAVPGSLQRVSHSGSSTESVIAQRITQSGSNYTPGDWLEIGGVITTSGVVASVQPQFYVAPYSQRAIRFNLDVTRGFYSSRIRVPLEAGPGYIDMMLNTGPGTGTADFGQFTIRNLTTLGLV